MKNTAVCFVGAIGLARSEFAGTVKSSDNSLIDYVAISKINKKRIIDVNENVDVFIHCWTPPAEENMVINYNPKLYLFEDNDIYAEQFSNKCKDHTIKKTGVPYMMEFNRASFLFSIKKSLLLLKEFEEKENIKYDKILVIRPDVVLFKELNMSDLVLEDNIVISNDGRAHPGDFFYIMNSFTAYKFLQMYDIIDNKVSYDVRTMPVDLAKELGVDIVGHPNFLAGPDIEVSRKCNWK